MAIRTRKFECGIGGTAKNARDLRLVFSQGPCALRETNSSPQRGHVPTPHVHPATMEAVTKFPELPSVYQSTRSILSVSAALARTGSCSASVRAMALRLCTIEP